MGLIKTAIVSGVGIYGINKLAKAANHRQSSRSPQQQQQQTYYSPPQDQRSVPQGQSQGGYWGPPPPATQSRELLPDDTDAIPRSSEEDRLARSREGQVWYPAAAPPQQQSQQGFYRDEREYAQGQSQQYPPPYAGYDQRPNNGNAQQQQQGQGNSMADAVMGVVGQQFGDGDRKGRKRGGGLEKLFK